MQPQQTPDTHHQSYDFIMSPGQAPKKSLIPGGNSMARRLMMVAAGGVVLIIVVIIVSSILNSGPNNKLTLTKVAQQQAELVRVASLNSATGTQATKNIAINVSTVIASDNKALVTVLAQKKIKISPKTLRASSNSDTDKRLDAAKAASAFDATFLQILDDQLTDYETTIQSGFTNSKSKTVKDLLATDFNNAHLLQKQITNAK